MPLFAHATADAPPKLLIIAELGVNHDGDLDRARMLLNAAAEAGADAIKLQLFRPDRLLSNQARLAGYQVAQAADPFDLLAKLTLPMAAMHELRAAARRMGLAFLATPFSLEDVEDARSLDLDAVKIASPDAVNLPLLAGVRDLGAPLLISTGTCHLDELGPAATAVREHAAGGALLQCVSSYPVPPQQAALAGISVLRERLGVAAGYSDHTPGVETGALAVCAGAVVLEKHLTYDRTASGPDHAASLEPEAFAAYVAGARQAAAMLGPVQKRVLPVEADVREVSRQSLCVVRDLAAGHKLTAADLTVKRPGTGIPAAQWDAMLGRPLRRPVRRNDLLMPGDI